MDEQVHPDTEEDNTVAEDEIGLYRGGEYSAGITTRERYTDITARNRVSELIEKRNMCHKIITPALNFGIGVRQRYRGQFLE